jgi:di/tripeptidase
VTELRTNADIVRDLLKFLIDHQWLSGDVYLGHGDYATGCEDCGANSQERFNERDTHNPGCPRAALILEAQAFLTAEAAAEKTFEVERDETPRLECLYKKIMSDDEDYYYRIFPADTNMLWSGDHEMHRGAKS